MKPAYMGHPIVGWVLQIWCTREETSGELAWGAPLPYNRDLPMGFVRVVIFK